MTAGTLDVEGYGINVRTARAGRRCANAGYDDDCTREIKPGDRYVRHVASPRSEYGDGRWCSMSECAPCYLNRKRAGKTVPEPLERYARRDRPVLDVALPA